MKGVKHSKTDGTIYRGNSHKMADGTLHTGVRHSKSSTKLFHYGELSKKSKNKARSFWGK